MGRVTLITTITSTSTAGLSNIVICILKIIEDHAEPSITSKAELYSKTINGWILLSIFSKCSIFDFTLGSENAPEDITRFIHVRLAVLFQPAITYSQPAFTCSKLTVETLEQGVKYDVVLVSLLLTLNIFHTLF